VAGACSGRHAVVEQRRCATVGDLRAGVARDPVAVAEADALERHLAPYLVGRQLARALPLLDVDRQVEVLEHPLEQRERALHVDADRQQRLDREEEPRLERGEGDERPDRDRGAAAGHAEAAEQVDERGHRGEGNLDRGHPPASRHAGADLYVGELARLPLEALRQRGLAPHRAA
jgi:hypothetical protein